MFKQSLFEEPPVFFPSVGVGFLPWKGARVGLLKQHPHPGVWTWLNMNDQRARGSIFLWKLEPARLVLPFDISGRATHQAT